MRLVVLVLVMTETWDVGSVWQTCIFATAIQWFFPCTFSSSPLGFPPFELEARVGVYTTVVPLQVCFLRQTVTRFDLSLLVCCIFLFLSSECYFKSVGVFYLRKQKKTSKTKIKYKWAHGQTPKKKKEGSLIITGFLKPRHTFKALVRRCWRQK